MPTISVIIPAYNRANYLSQAIDSALAQTHPPHEVIVVDDGSTDTTAAVAAAYGSPVRCLSQPNQGVGAARNTGLRIATGSHIALLDSDDLWEPTKLALQLAWLQAHPDTAMVFCHMKPFLSPEIQSPRPFDARPVPAVNAGTLLARREVFTTVGPFTTTPQVQEFFDWFARACDAHFTHHVLPQVLMLRRVHLTNSVHDPQSRLNYVRFLKQRLDQTRART